jgi:hypothetical protein
MDKTEAQQVLDEELSVYRRCAYDDLTRLVGQKVHKDRISDGGATYQMDVEIFWDDKRKGTIRVLGAIDDASLRYAIFPLSQDFIMAPDGSLVGE